jgi:hypothetical protein
MEQYKLVFNSGLARVWCGIKEKCLGQILQGEVIKQLHITEIPRNGLSHYLDHVTNMDKE